MSQTDTEGLAVTIRHGSTPVWRPVTDRVDVDIVQTFTQSDLNISTTFITLTLYKGS